MDKVTNKKFTIFISSTYLDLKDYRETVRTAILRMRNHASDMIYWTADERRSDTLSVDELREADLVILILAHRYGTIPSGEDRGITEIEYDATMEMNKPIIPFLVDKKYSWPGELFDWKQYEKLERFKNKIVEFHTPGIFTTEDSLAASVTQALANFDERTRRVLAPVITGVRIIDIRNAEALETIPDAVIHVGESEDGLPLVLSISRSDDLDKPLAIIKKAFEPFKESGVNAQFTSMVQKLQKESERSWATRGIEELYLPSGENCRAYLSMDTISSMFKSSILAFLLTPPYVGEFKTELSRKVTTAKLNLGSDSRIQSVAGNNRFLALSLSDSKRYVVGKQLNATRQYICVAV